MRRLSNLNEWNLTEADLPRLSQVAAVHIQLQYPDYHAFVQYPPQKRIREIDKLLRQNQQRLLALLPPGEMETTGWPRRPNGVRIRLPLHELPRLQAPDFIGRIMVEAIDGMEPQPKPDAPAFWCVEARFAIRIENETKGLQTYEDRLLIIMADSAEAAKKKLSAGLDAYAAPYLNSNGQLVSWQFEAFLDAYRVDVDSVDGFANEQGVEVFSRLKRRRLRPDAA